MQSKRNRYNLTNLMLCGFNGRDHCEIMEKMMDVYGKSKCVIISNQKIESCKNNVTYYNFNDFALGEHKDIKMENFYPIDESLIRRMAFCERIYMDMLNRLEVKLGRIVGYKEREKNYLTELRILNHTIESNKIEICIIDYIPHLGFDYILYELCKLKNIKVVMQCYGMAIPYKNVSRFFLKDIEMPLTNFYVRKERAALNDMVFDKRMSSYIDYYSKDKSEIKSIITLEALTKPQPKLLKYSESIIRMIKNNDKRLVPAIKLKVEEFFRLKKIETYFEKVSHIPDCSARYLYFPLHYQPECTSSPMAFSYTNQTLVVQMISAVLPDNVMLYIKAHPNPSIMADRDFYKELLKYRNVALLPAKYSTYDAIDNSIAVVTLTGTVGWEALVRSKQVMMFGNYFYQYAPGVFHIKTNEDCRNALNNIIEQKYKFNVEELKRFLNIFSEYLYEGYLDSEYKDIYEIDQQENINNTIRGYTDYIEDEENWR